MTTVPVRPPLVRSSDRVIAGVCAGLAEHLGWPVRMVRIGMAVAALAGGAGLVFYGWLWIMVPTADESARRNARRPASPIAPAVSMPPRWHAAQPSAAVDPSLWSAAYSPGYASGPVAPPGGTAAAAGPVGYTRAAGPAPSDRTTPGGPSQPQGTAAVPGGGAWFRVRSMRYGKEILLGAGLLLVAGHPDRQAARRRGAAGDADPGGGHPRRCRHRLDAA